MGSTMVVSFALNYFHHVSSNEIWSENYRELKKKAYHILSHENMTDLIPFYLTSQNKSDKTGFNKKY